jgi:hypothetical protein
MKTVPYGYDAVRSFESSTGTLNPDQITSMQTVNGREMFQQLLDLSRFIFHFNGEVNSNLRIGMIIIHFGDLLLLTWWSVP